MVGSLASAGGGVWNADRWLNYVLVFITSPPYRSVLLLHGFYPVAFRSRCYLVAAAYSTDPGLQVFVDLRKWFVTMGDGNLEMSF